MAYRTRRTYRKRRPAFKRTYAKRRTPRRSYAKRRPYARRPRTMSRKRILNITTEKKMDTMMMSSNVTAARPTPAPTTYSNSEAILTGGNSDEYTFVWCATARTNLVNAGGSVGTKFTKSTRTASEVYMRGLKEAIEIQSSSSLPWQWRRICFTYKGFALEVPGSTGYSDNLIFSEGYRRVVNEIPVGSPRNTLYDTLFQGEKDVDWVDPLVAKTDPDIITIRYDKTMTLSSGNEQGMIRKYMRWHPMNSKLIYDDDERGGSVNPSAYSARITSSMGDYYVVDIFRPRVGSTTSQQLLFRPLATLYWHEK
uniref:Capsid protein n=1 Tax=Red panda feces-associated gemycircularvirus TaxID=2864013 RepID=A0A8K1HIZ4_9VIRU|nr:capsid protein [Red panda feces-associated gemycircularvirus]